MTRLIVSLTVWLRMSEYYDKCQVCAASCHYSSPNHYDPNSYYVYQYGADQYCPDCYSCYPEHAEPLQGNVTPPSEDSHHSDVLVMRPSTRSLLCRSQSRNGQVTVNVNVTTGTIHN